MAENLRIGVVADTSGAIKSLDNFDKTISNVSKGIAAMARVTKKASVAMTNSFVSLSKSVANVGVNIAKTTALIGAAGLAGAVAELWTVVDDGRMLARMAANTGIAIDELEKWRVAAKLAGEDMETLNGGVVTFTENLGDAQRGNEQWASTFREVGVSIDQQAGPALEDFLRKLAQMSEEGRTARATQLGMEVMGSDFEKMFGSMISNGIDPFEERLQELGDLSAFNAGIVETSERFREEVNKMKVWLQNAFITVSPAIFENLTAVFRTFRDEFRFDFIDPERTSSVINTIINGAFDVANIFNNAVRDMRIGFTVISDLFQRDNMGAIFEYAGNVLKIKLLEAGALMAQTIDVGVTPDKSALVNSMSEIRNTMLQEFGRSGFNEIFGGWGEVFTERLALDARSTSTIVREITEEIDRGNEALDRRYALVEAQAAQGEITQQQYLQETAKLDIVTAAVGRVRRNLVSFQENSTRMTTEQVEQLRQENAEIVAIAGSEEEIARITAQAESISARILSLKQRYNAELRIERDTREEINNAEPVVPETPSDLVTTVAVDPNLFRKTMLDIIPQTVATMKERVGIQYDEMKNKFAEMLSENLISYYEYTQLMIAAQDNYKQQISEGMISVVTTIGNQVLQITGMVANGITNVMSANQQAENSIWNNEKKRREEDIKNMRVNSKKKEKLLDDLAEEDAKRKNEAFEKEKKARKSSVLMNTASAIMGGWSSVSNIPFPGNVIAGGILTGLFTGFGIAQIAAINKEQPAYATGGVVGGFNGATMGPDNQQATVRRGEMILNARQQRNLFNSINRGGLGAGNNITIARGDIIIEGNATEETIENIRQVNDEFIYQIRDTVNMLYTSGELQFA